MMDPVDFKNAVQGVFKKALGAGIKSVAKDVDTAAGILKMNTEELVRRVEDAMRKHGG